MTNEERAAVRTAFRPFMEALAGRSGSVSPEEWAAAVDRIFPSESAIAREVYALAEDTSQRFGDLALEKNTPEGNYARGAIGQAERTAKDISALCDAADLLHGMVGLIDLLLNRDDLTDELRGVLLNNHRVVDARAALAKHAAKP